MTKGQKFLIMLGTELLMMVFMTLGSVLFFRFVPEEGSVVGLPLMVYYLVTAVPATLLLFYMRYRYDLTGGMACLCLVILTVVTGWVLFHLQSLQFSMTLLFFINLHCFYLPCPLWMEEKFPKLQVES